MLHLHEKPLQASYNAEISSTGGDQRLRYYDIGVRHYPEPERSELQAMINRLKVVTNSEKMSIIFDYFEGRAYHDDSCWDNLFHTIARHSDVAEDRIRVAYNVNKRDMDQER